VVNDGTAVTGGIYIQGNVSRMTLSTPAANQQQYQIVQGTTTTTILINYTSNTTSVTVAPAGTTVSYTGAPNGQSALGTGGPTGQIYVNGTVSGLSAPARTATVAANSPDHPPPAGIPPALAWQSQLNITATGQVSITGDLIYECDPTQLGNTTYMSTRPQCNQNGQAPNTVLGVMSTTSSVQIAQVTPATNDIYLWGAYFASRPNQGLTVQNPTSRAAQGSMHLFGSLIQDQDQLRGRINSSNTLLNGFNERFDYDPRFQSGALTPPNFPTTNAMAAFTQQANPLSFEER
jgi:hypothetical protein